MILEEIQKTKETILALSKEALKSKILDESTFNEIEETLQREKIRIAVCGQVKTGKSTFVNALIFGKNILPVASSPMTAALSYITYGEAPQSEVEFYTLEEWRELEELAKGEDDDPKIKAAKEIIQANKELGLNNSLLGQRKKIKFEDIAGYAGSGGRFTPITKSVTVYIPNEILKSADIVDTPGTNDPVVSRERKTLEFLKDADVVFLCSYAGRPFDEADKELLHHLKNSTGKVVIVVNKKDIILQDEGSIEKVEKRFKEELENIAKSMEKEGESKLTIGMIQDAKNKIIFFSSLWALLGRMKGEDINSDENMKYHYTNFKEEFPQLKTQEDFLSESGLKEISQHIKGILEKEKKEIILKKPANLLLSAYEKRIKEKKKEKDEREEELEAYNSGLKEIEEEINQLKDIERKIREAVSQLELNAVNAVDEKMSLCRDIIDHSRDKLASDIETKLPKKGKIEKHSSYQKKCESFFDDKILSLKMIIETKLRHELDGLKNELEKNIYSFFEEVDRAGTRLVISRKYFNYAIIELKTKLPKLIKIEFDRTSKFKTSGWWFMGTSGARDEILLQIKKELISLKDKGYLQLDEFEQGILGQINYIKNKLLNEIIPSTKEPLEKAIENYKDKEKRKIEIGTEMAEIEREIEELNTNYNRVKDKIEKLI